MYQFDFSGAADWTNLIKQLRLDPAAMGNGGNVSIDFIRLLTLNARLGDISQDGVIDIGDFTLWSDAFGTTGVGLPADLSNDGEVDIGDFTIWSDNFGNTSGAGGNGAGVASVPEPSAVALLGLGVCGLLVYATRHSRRADMPDSRAGV